MSNNSRSMVHQSLAITLLFILLHCCIIYGAPKCEGLNKKYNAECSKFKLPQETGKCLMHKTKIKNKKGVIVNQFVCKIEHDPSSKPVKRNKVKDILSGLKAFDEASNKKKEKKVKSKKPSKKKGDDIQKIISIAINGKKETEIEYEFHKQSIKTNVEQKVNPNKRRLPEINNVNAVNQPPSNVLKATGALMIYDTDENQWKIGGSGALIKPMDSATSKYVLTVAHVVYLCHLGQNYIDNCAWPVDNHMRFFPGYTSQNAPQGDPTGDDPNPPPNSYAITHIYFPAQWRYEDVVNEVEYGSHNNDDLNELDWAILELDAIPDIVPIEIEARWTSHTNTRYPAQDVYYTVGYPATHAYKMMTTYNYNGGNPTGNQMIGYLVGEWKNGLGYQTDAEGVLDHGCSGGPTLNLNDNKIYGMHRKKNVEIISQGQDARILADDGEASVVITRDLWHLIQYIINGLDEVQFLYMDGEPQDLVSYAVHARYAEYGSNYYDEKDLYDFSHHFDYNFDLVMMSESVMMIDLFLLSIVCIIGCCLCGMLAAFIWMKNFKQYNL